MPTHASSVRVKKLRETLVAVQQLEKKMSSLRSWLAHIEMELSRPIVYDTCDEKEIDKKLNQQQVKSVHVQLYMHQQTQSSRHLSCASLSMLILTQRCDSEDGKINRFLLRLAYAPTLQQLHTFIQTSVILHGFAGGSEGH